MRKRHGQVEAREAGPLAVRREELRRLVAFDPPAPESRHELDQGQVADETALVTAEPFEADDACRPRAEPALPLDELGRLRGRQVVQALEVDRATDPDERGGAACVQAELSQPCRRESPERRARRRCVQTRIGDARLHGPHDRVLELSRSARLDHLSAEGSQQCLGDGRQPELTHSLEPSGGFADQRIAREALQELRMVRVERGQETQPLESLVTLRPQDDAPVDPLLRGADLDELAQSQGRREHAVAETTRCVARVLRGESERERPGGAKHPLVGQRRRAASVSASTPRSYARRRTDSASFTRPRRRREYDHSSAASPASLPPPWAARRSTARRYASSAPSWSPCSSRPLARAWAAAPRVSPSKSPRRSSAAWAASTARSASRSSAASPDSETRRAATSLAAGAAPRSLSASSS